MSGGSGTPRGLSSELMGRALLLGDPRGSSLGMPGTAPRTEPAGADTRPWLRFVPKLLRWPRVGWDLFRGQFLWWPGCGQQWNGTVPSPEHCTLPRRGHLPIPTPSPPSLLTPPGHAGNAEAEGGSVPCALPACSCSLSSHCFVQGAVSRVGCQSSSMGQCQTLPVPSKLLDSLWTHLGTPCPLTWRVHR